MKLTTIEEVARWRIHRKAFDPHDLNEVLSHQVVHVVKALGPISAVAEHRDHGEEDTEVEEKRVADLVIHAIWAGEVAGFDVPRLVRERMESFGDGFFDEEGQTDGEFGPIETEQRTPPQSSTFPLLGLMSAFLFAGAFALLIWGHLFLHPGFVAALTVATAIVATVLLGSGQHGEGSGG